ncbi:MAG: winged helix-turn-helix transcriptional regulator [Euryarchaeota archaeon]|nr:winged helix-turn-helix transcriptional regulator [Euryarchaeota archaeon]
MRPLLVLLVLLPAAVAGQEYYFRDYVIFLSPDSEGNALEEVAFTVINLRGNISAVEYAMATLPEEIRVYDDAGELRFYTEDSSVVVPLRKRLTPGESQRLRFVFTLRNVVSSYRDDSILTLSYVPDVRVVNFTFVVKLPKGSVLVSEQRSAAGARAAVYPAPDRILTDGEHIIIRWRKWELSPGESFRIFVMYTRAGEGGAGYALALAGALLGGALTYAYFRLRRMKQEEERSRVVKLVLREDEQRIFDLLEERGEILQEEVVRITGFSKAKVSKLVRNLEEKGIIRKEPYRKTNRLVLKKEFGGEG